MDWFWSKTRSGKVVEAGLHILGTAIGFDLWCPWRPWRRVENSFSAGFLPHWLLMYSFV
jgi:hypothetical protein